MFPYYQFELSLPVSVNASHTVGRNSKGGNIVRSGDYTGWLQCAYFEFRNQFPNGLKKFDGRIRVDYFFVWDVGSKGRDRSDISNREKVLSDFLEGKFYENDNQIDEQHHYRRILPTGKDFVVGRVYEIDDRRNNPIEDIFR